MNEKDRHIVLPDKQREFYIEQEPHLDYVHASIEAHESFRDMKFAVRIHWGLYSIWELRGESWPFLRMDYQKKQAYQDLYKTWNPVGFDASAWISFFQRCGFKSFAFTTKHHEGFCMFDTKTRVKQRMKWDAIPEPAIENCDLAYSIMETPFKRDIIKELCAVAHAVNMKIDLYFSHPDWYDADFRPYSHSPMLTERGIDNINDFDIDIGSVLSNSTQAMTESPTPEEGLRMMQRHRQQLTEILTNYGKIDMVCLDMRLGPENWPYLRDTMKFLRKIQPDVMFRNRGIGNYGDYYTPENQIPGSSSPTNMPWMVIYPLGRSFSIENDVAAHKGTLWVIQNLIDVCAKGGNFMVGIGPNGNGTFHPEAIKELEAAGDWIKTNGEGIYNTRPWTSWQEGDVMQAPEFLRCKEYPFKEIVEYPGRFVRFTSSKDGKNIYIFTIDWPENEFRSKIVKPKEKSIIHMLGVSNPLSWSIEGDELVIDTMSIPKPPCQYAWCFKIQLE